MLRPLLATLLILGAAPALAQPKPDPDWPCAQRKVSTLGPGSVWTGPDPTPALAEWGNDTEAALLAQKIASRRLPLEEVDGLLDGFAAKLDKADRDARLTRVFAGVFEVLNGERDKVVAGIGRYARGQRVMAERIRDAGLDVVLRELLDEVRGQYDDIVIDAPPNLGMLTWMALAAAQEVIIPVRTEPYDTMGVGLILGTVNKVQRRLNPALRLAGILPTQYSRRKAVDREVLEHLVDAMGDKGLVLPPVPESAVFGHAARNGRIALESSAGTAAVAVYERLAEAIVAGTAWPRVEIEEATGRSS